MRTVAEARGDGPGAVVVAGVADERGGTPPEEVLAIVAKRFAGLVRPADAFDWLAGGRFVVFLPNADVYVATIVAGRMLDSVDAPIQVGSATVHVTVAVGVDASTDRTLDEQLAAADAALDRARTTGRVEVAR